ncbi:putative signal transducer [Aspergillus mulundensis]|uniref:Vps72/YL1 C-terminal domain-containing protein n=1 Tax=Aspergillus mulundensis TaxID=1810919 RepID=A0A3D8RL70_9EURO|nr:hypothetical protein DSM5745_07362 [Aspergillus mulundensis]RDW74700.1 hypothetical protein DSM5745_07362 [Aspergillus mulundensis]
MLHDDERSSSEDEAPVQSLIQGREKRSTAGRQMSALLDAEADDELALLFEEVDDDNEFAADAVEEGGEEDEMGLDSSSDDEDDQGPNAQADDFEGERQIEKEEKEEKKKKRAREDLRYRITSKKVKIDPTAAPKAPTTPAPRPRKKSERVSWIPTLDEGPTRSSSRRQTMQNKELTHARLKDSEEKRIRLIATMEEAAKRKAKHKPKEMTQAERLAEAERVERHNSKSLNRWEEMEKRKAEERRAKIEALQNRRLEGPVISYWSGVATWADGRLTRVGKVAITPKPEKDDSGRKKSKKADKEGKAETEQKPGSTAEPSTSLVVPVAIPEIQGPPEPKQDDQPLPATDASQAAGVPQAEASITPQATVSLNQASGAPLSAAPSTIKPMPCTVKPISELDNPAGEQSAKANDEGTTQEFLDRPTSPASPVAAVAPEDTNTPTTDLSKAEEKTNDEMQQPASEQSPTTQLDPGHSPAVSTSHTPVTTQPVEQGSAEGLMEIDHKADIHVDETNPTAAESQSVAPPAVIEHTGRCLTVLENFDDKTAQSRDFSIYFNAKKPPRLTKISSSLCVITSLPSRYRDPDTSLPFANSYAYHEIRHTAAQKYSWSPMLGCYVGPAGIAARGVPDRFLDPNAKKTTKKLSGSGAQSSVPDKERTAKQVGDDTPTTATTAKTSTPALATAPLPPPPPAPAPTATAPSLAPIPTTAGAGDAMDVDK